MTSSEKNDIWQPAEYAAYHKMVFRAMFDFLNLDEKQRRSAFVLIDKKDKLTILESLKELLLSSPLTWIYSVFPHAGQQYWEILPIVGEMLLSKTKPYL